MLKYKSGNAVCLTCGFSGEKMVILAPEVGRKLDRLDGVASHPSTSMLAGHMSYCTTTNRAFTTSKDMRAAHLAGNDRSKWENFIGDIIGTYQIADHPEKMLLENALNAKKDGLVTVCVCRSNDPQLVVIRPHLENIAQVDFAGGRTEGAAEKHAFAAMAEGTFE